MEEIREKEENVCSRLRHAFIIFFIAKLTLDTVNIDISGDLDNRPFVKHWTFGIHNCRLVKDYRRRKKTETNINPWQCWYEA